MTTAEGGMLTGTPDFVEKCRIISLHGMSRDAWNRYSKEGSWYYEVLLPGFKYNMTDIQASLGLVQLEKLESFQLRRAEIVAKYNQEFKNYDALEIPVAKAEVEHAWHLYVLKLNLEALRINRNQFIEELKVRNIGTSVHFIRSIFTPITEISMVTNPKISRLHSTITKEYLAYHCTRGFLTMMFRM